MVKLEKHISEVAQIKTDTLSVLKERKASGRPGLIQQSVGKQDIG